ncbi:orange carotenoid protein N-terminal domain-containing protein [Nostoc sp.]|uniref:orange carotenoid protein N-terminal domain-containing protein n=1 Tax=Nostoc sp. TaxID=1180 RepID=UPI002FF601BD
MTSTNVNFLEQSGSKFQNLDTDDRLTVLALLYTEIGDEIPSLCLNNTPNEQAANLVAQVQNLPQQEPGFLTREKSKGCGRCGRMGKKSYPPHSPHSSSLSAYTIREKSGKNRFLLSVSC